MRSRKTARTDGKHGLSFSTSDGVLCVGGSDPKQCLSSVFLLHWESRHQTNRNRALSRALPETLAFAGGGILPGKTLRGWRSTDSSSLGFHETGLCIRFERWRKRHLAEALPGSPGRGAQACRSVSAWEVVGNRGCISSAAATRRSVRCRSCSRMVSALIPPARPVGKTQGQAGPLMAGTAVEYLRMAKRFHHSRW